VLTAFAYVELASRCQRAAGAAFYVNRAFKQPFFTFLVAFTVMCSGITSAGAPAIAFSGDYFKEFIDLPVVVVSLGFIVVVAVINAIGISESVKMNALFTCIEVVGLLLIVVIGLAALGTDQADFSRNLEFSGDGSPFLLVIAGASLAFYALIGFEDSVNVAEEVRHPAKSYPIALLGGLVAAAVIYTLVTMTASAVVPTQQHDGRAAAGGLHHRQRRGAGAAQGPGRARPLRRADVHPRARRHRQRGHGHPAHRGHLPAGRHPARRRRGAVVRQPRCHRRHGGSAHRRESGGLTVPSVGRPHIHNCMRARGALRHGRS
jgi:amino acid transporter